MSPTANFRSALSRSIIGGRRSAPFRFASDEFAQQLHPTFDAFVAAEARNLDMVVFEDIDFDPFPNKRNRHCDGVRPVSFQEIMQARRIEHPTDLENRRRHWNLSRRSFTSDSALLIAASLPSELLRPPRPRRGISHQRAHRETGPETPAGYLRCSSQQ